MGATPNSLIVTMSTKDIIESIPLYKSLKPHFIFKESFYMRLIIEAILLGGASYLRTRGSIITEFVDNGVPLHESLLFEEQLVEYLSDLRYSKCPMTNTVTKYALTMTSETVLELHPE